MEVFYNPKHHLEEQWLLWFLPGKMIPYRKISISRVFWKLQKDIHTQRCVNNLGYILQNFFWARWSENVYSKKVLVPLGHTDNINPLNIILLFMCIFISAFFSDTCMPAQWNTSSKAKHTLTYTHTHLELRGTCTVCNI